MAQETGVTNLYLFSTGYNGNVWEIEYWGYDNTPQRETSAAPNLTYEELFQEIEDEFPTFTADVFVVSADGNVTADQRLSLSRG